MRPLPLLPLMLAFCAGAAGAEGWGEPHLSIIPRTEDEAARVAAVTALATDFAAPETFELRPAGAATVRVFPNADAFSQPSANIGLEGELEFKVGNGLFRKIWVSAPSSTQASDGLGPLYNARGCQNCHLKDGRGHPPEPGEDAITMFLRLSVPGGDVDARMAEIEGYLASLPDPVYGGQLQNFGTVGHPSEGRMEISYTEMPVELAGGEVVMLRAPAYSIADAAYGPPSADIMLSPRVAPAMIGLGLLEAIPEADILAYADEDDADGDGISGRPNVVWSDEFGQPMLGRFGLKAGMPTIREQSAAAFSGDIGISTSLHPAGWGDCTEAQVACRAAPDGGDAESGLEVDDLGLGLVTFYSQNLAVPERRDMDTPEVLRGKEVFYEAGCTSCHVPKFVTHRLEDQPAQSFQLIWPYSDLLLHDMGEGLADNRPEARATGSEWRTAPLWGLGLMQQVNPRARFLHDGRARTVLEAVLWHGGEAQAARDRVVNLVPEDRAALVSFLESL